MADAAEDLVDFGPDDSDEDAAYLAAGTDLDPSGAAHGEGGDGAAGERASGGGARAALAAALGGGGRGDDVGAGGADGGAGGPDEDSYGGRGGQYESVEGSGSGSGPARSVEGWVIFVTGLHEESQEEDVLDAFSDVGTVSACSVDLDRRTGLVKGHALVEYEKYEEAEAAVAEMNGAKILGKEIAVDWAFVKDAERRGGGRRGRGRARGGRRSGYGR